MTIPANKEAVVKQAWQQLRQVAPIAPEDFGQVATQVVEANPDADDAELVRLLVAAAEQQHIMREGNGY